MYSVETDSSKRLFVITGAGNVSAAEVAEVRDEVQTLLQDTGGELVVLADFRFIESMKPDVARHIGEIMDLFAKKQVTAVVRVMPDANKDVGMNILSRLHYGPDVQVLTVATLVEAIVILSEP